MWTSSRLPYVLAPIAAIVSGLLLSLIAWPVADRGIAFTGLLLGATLASLHAPDRDWPALRPGFVVELASLILYGVDAAIVVAAAGLITRERLAPRSDRWWHRLLGAAALFAALRAAAIAYLAVGGTFGALVLPRDAVAVALAIAAYCVVTSAWCDVARPLLAGRRPEQAWRAWFAPALGEATVYLVGGSVAAAVAAMFAREAWGVIAVAAAPLYFADRIYAHHLRCVDREHRRGQALAAEVDEHKRAVQVLRQEGERLRQEGDRLRIAATVANDGLWEWNLASEQFHVTNRWKAMLGLADSTTIASPAQWLDRVHPEDAGPLKEAIDAHLSGVTAQIQFEHRIRHEDGSYKVVHCRGVAVRSAAGRAIRIAGSLTDTTDLAVTQQRLRHAVYLDPLTGLYNRAVLADSLRRRLYECQRRQGSSAFALLYLDLDRFKVVNDSLGHLVGDQLLVAVSRRLESCLRQGDVLARLGGDEFAILLNGLQADEQANVIAFRVQEALGKPFEIGGREVFTSASIGIAFGAAQYTTPDEMMHDADTAMYQAKAHGRAHHVVFDADMDARARDRVGLETALRRAVGNDEIETHYQPIVSLASGMCVGFESLVRWTRDGKPVSPATFIPIAEELGLIDRIGTRVLEEACRTFAAWQRAWPDAGLECITVNVSARQLRLDTFLRIVERAVRQAGLEPSALRIEITETALMASPEEAARVLSQLRDFGVKIYLDDFGTGYSSLSHLHKLPVDALKIDRSFVKSLTQAGRPAIVESILALARTLHTSVVAEGIETAAQARELERLGCTHAQGFLFSRPVSKACAEAIVVAGRPLGPKNAEAIPNAAA